MTTSQPQENTNLFDTQHEHITSCLTFHLHPTITAHIQDLASSSSSSSGAPIQIADLTSSTGTPLSSLSHSLKSQFPSLTFSLTAFDPSPTRPKPLDSSIPFHTFDVLSPQSLSSSSSSPTSAFAETFDVILISALHLPLISRSPQSDDGLDPWSRTLSTISSMLKPGGWMQWRDFDPLTPRIAATRPLAPDAEVRLLLAEFVDGVRARAKGNGGAGAGRVRREMERVGLREVDGDIYPLRPRVEFTRGLVEDIGGWIQRWDEGTKGQGRERVQRCLEEVEGSGALVWYDLWCHVGRKEG